MIFLSRSYWKRTILLLFFFKYDLGVAVVEDLIQEWNQQLIVEILPINRTNHMSRLSKMLEWAIHSHAEAEKKSGCPIGNLAIEMSEHEEEFRQKIQQFFERWIGVCKRSFR